VTLVGLRNFALSQCYKDAFSNVFQSFPFYRGTTIVFQDILRLLRLFTISFTVRYEYLAGIVIEQLLVMQSLSSYLYNLYFGINRISDKVPQFMLFPYAHDY